MTISRKIIFRGWGNFPICEGTCFRPEKRKNTEEIVEKCEDTLIARGCGKSYGDAAITTAHAVDMTRMKKFISFDKKKGIITCQGGTSLEDILAISIPVGWILPVIPGTKKASIGGAFACNIHGKNHYREGELADHVSNIKLRLANNEIITCTPTKNKDLFRASAGGMGMTGIIEEISVKLKKISSASLKSFSYTITDINEMVECFYEHQSNSDYMIGWIDHCASDDSLGRGVFEYASHIDVAQGGKYLDKYDSCEKSINIPFYFPSFVLNKYVMKLYNHLRFKKYSEIPQDEIVDFNGFFHPLDGLGNWNKLYGKRGFIQYQCLIPESKDTVANLHKILSMIKDKGLFSYLAVIKYHKKPKGLLSFSDKGFSLALDFPNTDKVHNLINELNEYVIDIGGKVYLAKDALLTREQFEEMYKSNLQEWKKYINAADPDKRFMSSMAERLGFKDE